jgi:hypothetical protein
VLVGKSDEGISKMSKAFENFEVDITGSPENALLTVVDAELACTGELDERKSRSNGLLLLSTSSKSLITVFLLLLELET